MEHKTKRSKDESQKHFRVHAAKEPPELIIHRNFMRSDFHPKQLKTYSPLDSCECDDRH